MTIYFIIVLQYHTFIFMYTRNWTWLVVVLYLESVSMLSVINWFTEAADDHLKHEHLHVMFGGC